MPTMTANATMTAGLKTRNVALDALRAFVTLLVVAHHAALAYVTLIPCGAKAFTAVQGYWMAFPVVDVKKWAGFDLFVGWNDIFFMSLMFLVSGIFVWPSLERKGGMAFLKDRVVRLGLPFAVAVTILAPLSYYPTYLLTGAPSGLHAYAKAWMALGEWPTGPAWFIWVLLAFDGLAALLYAVAIPAVKLAGSWWTRLGERPVSFFLAVTVLSTIAYGTMFNLFGPLRWFNWGPLQVQAARVLQYCLYFLVGLSAGVMGTRSGLFVPMGRLARRWWMWTIIAVVAFALEIICSVAGRQILGIGMFALSCAASSLFLIAAFLRFSKGGRTWESLSRNGYGIYLVHYVFVTWLQYALLGLALPAILKLAVVLTGAIGFSWMTSIALRRIPGVKEVI
jgi:surface polysaccharide O-acyltransferase-like enzyme